MVVVWAPNQYDLLHRVDTDLTNQARIEGDLNDLAESGAFEPLCGPISVPNHRAVPRLAFDLEVRPSRIVSSSEQRQPRRGYFLDPASPFVVHNFVLDPNDPARSQTPVPPGFRRGRPQRVLGSLPALSMMSRCLAPELALAAPDRRPRRSGSQPRRRRPSPRAGRRSRRPRPGSGNCRARSTSRSRPRSMRWTGSKPRGGPSSRLHRLGRRVICYLDVGSWESYRPDAGSFPKSVLGDVYSGYPDERWLDIREIAALAPILRKRFDLCRGKGFDAVEPDNIAGYENKTGFPLSGADQLRFNRWVAREVHRRGMSVALKNDPAQVGSLVGDFDFAVVEECFEYDECREVQPLHRSRQGGLLGRVRRLAGQLLPEARKLGFSTIGKGYDLFARPWRPC